MRACPTRTAILARLFLELRVRLLEGFAHLRPGLVGSARKLHPGVARGRLHLAQLLDRLIAPLAERGQLFLELGAHARLRLLGLRLPFRRLGVPLVELRLELLDVFVAVDHESSWLSDRAMSRPRSGVSWRSRPRRAARRPAWQGPRASGRRTARGSSAWARRRAWRGARARPATAGRDRIRRATGGRWPAASAPARAPRSRS